MPQVQRWTGHTLCNHLYTVMKVCVHTFLCNLGGRDITWRLWRLLGENFARSTLLYTHASGHMMFMFQFPKWNHFTQNGMGTRNNLYRCDINRLFLQTAIFRLTGLVPSQVIPDCSRWFCPRLFFSWLLPIPDSVDGYCFNKQQHKWQTEGVLKWGISSQRKSVTGMIMLVNVLHKARW